MTEEEKEPYTNLAKIDRQLYEKRLEQREKLGYFKFEDNTKSTDPNNIKRVAKNKSSKKLK